MSDHRQAAPPKDLRSWPKDAVRICFGVVWLIDASLKWLPGFRASFLPTIMAEAQGQPGWLRWWFDFWINFQHPRALFFAYLVAVIETLIALAVTFGVARKFTYVSASVFSFLIWSTAEGFGGPYTSGATDVGTSIIYVFVFLCLLALAYYTGPSRYTLDYYIEQRFSWWWRLAEMRRPAAVGTPLATADAVPSPPAQQPVVAQATNSDPGSATP